MMSVLNAVRDENRAPGKYRLRRDKTTEPLEGRAIAVGQLDEAGKD